MVLLWTSKAEKLSLMNNMRKICLLLIQLGKKVTMSQAQTVSWTTRARVVLCRKQVWRANCLFLEEIFTMQRAHRWAPPDKLQTSTPPVSSPTSPNVTPKVISLVRTSTIVNWVCTRSPKSSHLNISKANLLKEYQARVRIIFMHLKRETWLHYKVEN